MKKYILILLFALFGISISAEVIKDIKIINKAGVSYDISSVAAFTSFKIGERVSDQDVILASIASDVNVMRECGRYSYVNARMDVEPDGTVTLIYTVVSKLKLRRLAVDGAQNMKNRKVRRKSELELGQFADDATFAQAAAKIKTAYRDHWYPDTTVIWEAKSNEEAGTVDVLFQIKEGRKLGIKKIVFEGNDGIEDKVLRKVMKQKKKWFLSFITGAGKYKPEYEDMDIFAIKSLYMNAGYLDVTVADPILDTTKPKKSRLIIRINEGKRYRINEITVSGVENFSNEELLRYIRVRKGEFAAYEAIESGREGIRAFYGNRGYVRTNVRPIFDADPDAGTVDIRYEVGEGAIGYISKVNIYGSERTKDKVIRRELVIYPGDKYNRARVKTSENRLRNLNYFDVVSATTEATGEADQYDLNIQVNEKSTGQFSAGVGFSSVDAIVGYVELSQGNFDYKAWPPVGAGQKFKIRAQLGTERNDLDISFVEPWFLDRKLSFGIDLFHRESRYFSDDYDQKNNGIRLSLGKPLSRFSRGTLAYTLEQFEVYDVDTLASQAIRNEEGKRISSGLDFTWTRDTRDNFMMPSRGSKTAITPYFSGGALGGETDIFGARIRSTYYWPMIGGTVLNIRGQVESVDHYGDSDFVPIFDRIFLGGSYTLRGFEFREVGPKEGLGGEPIGGNTMAYTTVEYTVPIWSKVRGAIFYDVGFVNRDSLDFSTSDYNDDWGLGIRLDLPGFPLNLDYAWPITYDEDPLSDQDGKGRFNFLIGHSF